MGWDRGGGAEVHGDGERDSGYQMGVKQHSSGNLTVLHFLFLMNASVSASVLFLLSVTGCFRKE